MPESKFQGADRRRFVRIPFWFITKYRVYPRNSEPTREPRQGIGKNISTGGICFEANDKFNKDDALEIEIDMPALEHAVSVIGKIAWKNIDEENKRFVYGLEFTKIKSEDLLAVKRIIETFS